MKRITAANILILCLVAISTSVWAVIDNQGVIAKYNTVALGSQYKTSDSEADAVALERIITVGRTDNRIMEYLDYLCNEIGGRPAGSDNVHTASEWARDKFISFGLSNVHIEESSHTGGGGCGSCSGDSNIVRKIFWAIKSRFTKNKTIPIYNVVADIPGTQYPDEYVIVGAHIDSDDAGTGASDNGTGVAATLEAARLLMESGAKPRRTIRFILFDGEEIGKIGSQAYVSNHPELTSKITAMLNMDQGSDHISGIHATEAMMGDFRNVFAPIESLNQEMPFKIEKVDHLSDIIKECCGSAGTSDHGSFFEAGVPAFSWLQQGKNPVRYQPHTKHDTYDKVNPDHQEHSTMVVAIGALGIANLDHMLYRSHSTSLVDQDSPNQPKIINWCYKLLMSYKHIVKQVRQDSTPAIE